MWEVGGRRPGAELTEPQDVPPLAEGVPELQQAGADAALVVPAERLLPDLLPRVVERESWSWKAAMRSSHAGRGCPQGEGCHIHVAPGEVGRQRAPLALVRGVPVEEGQ